MTLLQRCGGGADVALRVGRLAASADAGWRSPRYAHLALLPLPPRGLEASRPAACHVLDGPTLLVALPVRLGPSSYVVV